MIVLDTHALIWLDQGSPDLGPGALQAIEAAHRDDRVCVSAISFWEVAMLVEKGRLRLSESVLDWRRELLGAGLQEIAVTGELGTHGATLESFHGDPADRLITATAIAENSPLVTADRKILQWGGSLQRIDARS